MLPILTTGTRSGSFNRIASLTLFSRSRQSSSAVLPCFFSMASLRPFSAAMSYSLDLNAANVFWGIRRTNGIFYNPHPIGKKPFCELSQIDLLFVI
jgi:hypothetical protein